MNTIQTIAVVGSTGMLGTPVTKILKQQGYSVTAVARDMSKAQRKLGAEIYLLKGDLQDRASLRTAFADVDFVYLSLNTQPGEEKMDFKTEIDGIRNVIEAAKSARVKRIGHLSSLVKDFNETGWWVFDVKNEACRILKEADIPVTIFYPSNFFENITHLQLKGNRVMLAGDQKTKSWWIGTRDYGLQVANAFRVDSGHDENREYPVQGLQPFNMEEAADEFIKHHPNPGLTKFKAPLGVLKLMKPLNAKMDYQYQIIHAINNYDEKFQSEKTWEVLGKPEQSLAKWASEQG